MMANASIRSPSWIARISIFCRSQLLLDTFNWLDERRVPFDDPPLADQSLQNEGIALDEVFGGLPRGEDGHRTLRRISQRPGAEQHSAGVELVQPGAMRRIVLADFRPGICRDFVKRDNSHGITSPVLRSVPRCRHRRSHMPWR